jgi:chemotaxis protein MotA
MEVDLGQGGAAPVDKSTVFGLLIAIMAVLSDTLFHGGNPLELINVPALVLIIGGSVGATMIGAPFKDFMSMFKAIPGTFKEPKDDPGKIIDLLVEMAEKARKEGLLALQDDLARIDDPLLARGINLIVDGIDPDVVRETLNTQVEMEEHQALAPAHIMEQAGGYAPTIGILGTVIGLINVLKNLAEADKLGPAIATAFMATFYGIATANLFWIPLATKVKANIAKRALIGRMIIVGVTGLQTGEAPRSLKEKLEIFLHDDHGKKGKAQAAAAAEEE